MSSDKKKVDENLKFILLNDIGKAYIENSVAYEKIKLTIKDIKLESTGKFYDNHLSYSSPHSIDLYSSRKQPLVSLLRELSQMKYTT